MIRLENITKIYNEKVDDTKALDDVRLKIEDGEFISVMGASGSGKSTLLKIIGCMDTAGKYFLDDTEVTAASRSQVHKLRKEKIGYVFQHFALMDYYTAYENIELPLLAANVKRKERKRIILKQMEHLGILSERNKLPGKMSGGQQQRVAIARALVTNADIILADEPTGALDQKTGHEVLELLKEINKSGKTVIIVTHDEGIAKVTDRIITISDGKIVGDN
jgi:putative ABC transport system ATP-binding protein